MLRARKKDVRIKPNRKLDKRSSRGMLYENEELRLRTIEINAEVERGQTDIKKLRRENDHLRREMWALRDEYERLEKLIKHLDLAGTGSEHHQRGHQHSDGEGGTSRTGNDDDDDDDEDDRASPSVNGRNSNSEPSDDECGGGHPDPAMDRDGHNTLNRSKSQSAVMTEFRPPIATPSAAAMEQDICRCHGNLTCHPCGQLAAVYVECGNPDKDNIENYQKAYGRMPRRCSSAGAKVYVATQHFHPHAPTATSVSSMTDSIGSRACYESLSAVKSRYSTSGMEDEDGYAACSHPVRVDLRDFIHGEHPSGCPNRSSLEMLAGSKTPPVPPPVPSTSVNVVTTAVHHPVHRSDFVVDEDLMEATDEGGSSGVEAEDEPSASGVAEGTIGAPGFPPDTPSEDGEFNLDHLVHIVRSFQQEQELHESGLVVVPVHPLSPTTPTGDSNVLVEEAEDDPQTSPYSSSPEASGMATIKRRPGSVNQEHQRHRQMSIIERDVGAVSAGSPEPDAGTSSSVTTLATLSTLERKDESGGGGLVTYAQPKGRAAGGRAPARRNSISSTSSSSASGSPTTATHSSAVVFLNNNNNNHNMNTNKKIPAAISVGYVGCRRDSDTSLGHVATSSTIDSIVLSSSRKSSSPVRFVSSSHVLPLPPPPPPPVSTVSLEPTVIVTEQGTLSRRRADQTVQQEQPQAQDDRSSLSVYPLPDGDASASLLRLHAVDPHTVSFDIKELTGARSVTVQEVIDQLEQQLDPTRCHVRGVRMLAGSLFFISLDSLRSLQYLLRHSFRLRGHRVRLTDVSAQTWIVSLTGVPHYISDATVSMLLAAFGTIVGDVERRFFRGVDTGERLVRFRLKGHAKLPRHITVGGCRIQVRRMSPAPSQRAQSEETTASAAAASAGSSGMNRLIRLDSQSEHYGTTGGAEAVSSSLSVGGGEGIYGSKSSIAESTSKKSAPKIGRSFEYRSQLRVDLRMSAEVPVPPLLDADLSPSSGSIPAANRNTSTPNCPVCDQQQNTYSTSGSCILPHHRRTSPPPPPLPPAMVIHRCGRHHGEPISPVAPGMPVLVSTTGPTVETRVHRESPPKSRVSVNFDETTGAAGRAGAGSGAIRSSNTKTSTSSSSNGILRKSVSGEEPPPASSSSAEAAGNDGSNSAAGSAESGQGKGKNGLRPASSSAKKTARSFSLVDTFRVNKERRKPVVRVETVIENASSAGNTEEGVRTLVVRRDSAESSSRSSRSSRKSNELPWCGCWGNGCL